MANGSDAIPAAAAAAAVTRVFLSYSRTDAAFAVWLREQLEARNVEVYRDLDDTLPGEEWWARLQGLISKADSIVFVLSPNSVASRACADEVRHSTSLGKRIFPAVIADVAWDKVPEGLAKIHSIFFRHDDTQAAALDALMAALLTDIGWVREHSRLGDIARRWTTEGGSDLLLRGRALEAAETWLASQPKSAEAPTGEHRSMIKASRDAARRRRSALTGALGAGLLVTAGLAAWAFSEQQRATANEKLAVEQRTLAQINEQRARSERDQALTNQSRGLVEIASNYQKAGDADTAALIALEALPSLEDASPRPVVAEAERKLWDAGNANRLTSWFALTSPAVIADDRSEMLVAETDGSVVLVNTSSGVRRARLRVAQAKLRPFSYSGPTGRALIREMNELLVWDIVLDKIVARLEEPDGLIVEAIACPTLDRIVVVNSRGAIKMWVPGGEPAAPLVQVDEAFSLAWQCSPDGKRLIASGSQYGVAIWDTNDGKEIGRFTGEYGIFTPRFSPDGQRIALISSHRSETPVLLDANAKVIATLKGHQRGTFSWTFSRDSRFFVTTSDDRTARVWHAKDGQPGAVLEGHGATVVASALRVLSKGQLRVLTASSDGTARLWDGDSGAMLAVLPESGAQLTGVDFSPPLELGPGEASDDSADDLNPLLAAGKDGAIRIWNLENGVPEVVHTLKMPEGPLTNVKFNSTGSGVIGISDNNAVATWTLRLPSSATALSIRAASGDSGRIARVQGGAVVVQNVADRQVAGELRLKGHTDQPGLRAVFLDRSGTRLATAAGSLDDRSIRIWEVASGRNTATMTSSGGTISALAVNRTGNSLAVGTRGSGVEIFDVDGRTAPRVLDAAGQQVLDVAWSPDSQFIAAAGAERAIIWDSVTGAQLKFLDQDGFGGRATAFSPDGTRIATLSGYGRLKLWRVPGFEEIAAINMGRRPSATTRLAFDPTGARIVVSDIAVVDAATLRFLAHDTGKDIGVFSPYFTADGAGSIVMAGRAPRVVAFHRSLADLVRHARGNAQRCLSVAFRRAAFLGPEPPDWCITGAGLETEAAPARWRPLPPYTNEEWRRWLLDVRAGKTTAMPWQ